MRSEHLKCRPSQRLNNIKEGKLNEKKGGDMSYKIKQISNDNQISFIEENNKNVEQYPIVPEDSNMDFQQLVLRLENGTTFLQNKNYLIQV